MPDWTIYHPSTLKQIAGQHNLKLTQLQYELSNGNKRLARECEAIEIRDHRQAEQEQRAHEQR